LIIAHERTPLPDIGVFPDYIIIEKTQFLAKVSLAPEAGFYQELFFTFKINVLVCLIRVKA